MDKKKKEIIMIGILVPVLGFVLYNSLSSVSKKKKPSAATVEEAAPLVVEAPAKAAAVKTTRKEGVAELPPLDEKLVRQQEVIADGPWGRDPFSPPPVAETDQRPENWKDFKLSGIIPGLAATINGEPVGMGEDFEGYRLREVGNDGITLEKDDQSFILTMPEEYPDEKKK